jgi:hypothetical protein
MPGEPAIRRVAIGRGWGWIAAAFGLFRRSPVIWIALHLVLLLIALGLGLIPWLGTYLIYLLTPPFLAGLMSACADAERGREIEIGHLFKGFVDNASPLITLGGIYLVGNVVVAGVAIALGGAALQEVMQAASEGSASVDPAVTDKALLAVLVSAALFVPLAMALWFAPALVMLDRVPAPKALVLSVQACLANLLPFLVYGLIMSALLFVALLPALLGLVLWVPIAMLSTYTAYREVFVPAAAPPG